MKPICQSPQTASPRSNVRLRIRRPTVVVGGLLNLLMRVLPSRSLQCLPCALPDSVSATRRRRLTRGQAGCGRRESGPAGGSLRSRGSLAHAGLWRAAYPLPASVPQGFARSGPLLWKPQTHTCIVR